MCVFGKGIYQGGKYTSGDASGTGMTKEYMLWYSMFDRCYSGKYKSYEGCSVCDEFLCFQDFMQWAEVQVGFNVEGFQLDKDLLVKNNKVYSPSTCVFIPSQINSLLVSNRTLRGKLPVGVSFKNNKFRASMSVGGTHRHIGYFLTPDEAFQAYKVHKEDLMKSVAIRFRDKIDVRAYLALLAYTVDISD